MHFVTYFLAGLVASSLLDYRWAFEQPVIRDYMVPFASTAVFLGPALQVVRGMIFELVLLPFRHSMATRLGWLWLWALVISILRIHRLCSGLGGVRPGSWCEHLGPQHPHPSHPGALHRSIPAEHWACACARS